MTRYREPMAHRRSRFMEALDVISFLGVTLVVLFLLSIADVR